MQQISAAHRLDSEHEARKERNGTKGKEGNVERNEISQPDKEPYGIYKPEAMGPNIQKCITKHYGFMSYLTTAKKSPLNASLAKLKLET